MSSVPGDEQPWRVPRHLQPWSESVRHLVVAARERAWGEYRQAVTRSQKYRAIGRYFIASEKFEVRWPEAKGVFDVYRELVREFLDDPSFGAGRGRSVMSADGGV